MIKLGLLQVSYSTVPSVLTTYRYFKIVLFFMDPQCAVKSLHKLTICVSHCSTVKILLYMMHYDMHFKCHVEPLILVQYSQSKLCSKSK